MAEQTTTELGQPVTHDGAAVTVYVVVETPEPTVPTLEPLITETPVTYKRYLLLKQHAALLVGNSHLAGVWRERRESLPAGLALPTNFPFRDRLVLAGYNERECLYGATVRELHRTVGLAQFDAEAVLAAYAALA